jgi:hypothetical protein
MESRFSKKTAPEELIDQRELYRCGSPGFGLGSGVGPSRSYSNSILVKSASIRSFPKERQTATAIVIPGLLCHPQKTLCADKQAQIG